MKLISTRVHGMLDYATVGAFCVLPVIGGATKIGQRVMFGFAAGLTLYSTFTNYELGIVKKIPMPVHLSLDALTGLMLCGAAFMHKGASSRATTLGLGLFELLAASCTETKTSYQRQPRTSTAPVAQIGKVYQQISTHR